MLKQTIFQQKLNWVTTDENNVLAFRNFNPQLKIDPKVKDGYAHDKLLFKRVKELKLEEIERKQMFYHPVHGLIKVKDFTIEEDVRKAIVFYAYKDGKTDSETKYELTQEDLKDLQDNITIEVKIHLFNGETIEQDLQVSLDGKQTFQLLVKPIIALI